MPVTFVTYCYQQINEVRGYFGFFSLTQQTLQLEREKRKTDAERERKKERTDGRKKYRKILQDHYRCPRKKFCQCVCKRTAVELAIHDTTHHTSILFPLSLLCLSFTMYCQSPNSGWHKSKGCKVDVVTSNKLKMSKKWIIRNKKGDIFLLVTLQTPWYVRWLTKA